MTNALLTNHAIALSSRALLRLPLIASTHRRKWTYATGLTVHLLAEHSYTRALFSTLRYAAQNQLQRYIRFHAYIGTPWLTEKVQLFVRYSLLSTPSNCFPADDYFPPCSMLVISSLDRVFSPIHCRPCLLTIIHSAQPTPCAADTSGTTAIRKRTRPCCDTTRVLVTWLLAKLPSLSLSKHGCCAAHASWHTALPHWLDQRACTAVVRVSHVTWNRVSAKTDSKLRIRLRGPGRNSTLSPSSNNTTTTAPAPATPHKHIYHTRHVRKQ